ncbi:competence protein CoiA [Neobacillus mesonae]|uniref:competence protein CoiA n=1 Tax=Neobacillus mesonae TaxID=1193713 RepID=UPI0013E054EA|nr:competence protein CoiA family protein [Neobacillus mesonae]
MLTASTKAGKTICLGNEYRKETLISLREKEEFICPICGEGVILKLGNQRIFHFAHKRGGTCADFFDGETENHLEGKLQLYRWLIGQKIPAILEYYDREIQQRPDIMFKYQGHKYALEYQCSRLPEQVFIKRTRTYLQNGYIPIWIIASEQLHFKKDNIVSLANFHYLFLRSSEKGSLYIPAYCPEKRFFHFLDTIIPFSVKNAFAHHSVHRLDNTNLQHLLAPARSFYKISFTKWEAEVNHFKLHWGLSSGARSNHFLYDLYNHNLNLFLLPCEIGLPVPHSLFFQTSPIVWQTYLYFDVLMGRNQGDLCTLGEIKYQINRRIERKELNVRQLPQLDSVPYMEAVMDYFFLLERLGVLTKISETTFQLKQKFVIPGSNREKEEMKELFHQKIKAFSRNNK